MPVFNRGPNNLPRPGTQSPATSTSTTSKPAETPAQGQVELKAPKTVTTTERSQAAEEAAKKLIATVETHKDRDGKAALEGFGKGDPRVTERRSALSTLIAEKSGAVVDPKALKAISSEIAKDISFLQETDQKEYVVGAKDQFEWFRPYTNNTVNVNSLTQEFDKRVSAQKTMASAVSQGAKKFFDVSTMSVVGLGMIADGEKRGDSMMDALLQFRGRTDKANQKEDAWTTRIDRFGVALLAEQRALLGSAKLDGSAQGNKDYALLREIISSHPISSTNQIYEARNAVATILTDQGSFADRMSSERSPTAWIWKEKAPGATASPYSSIHHNFSRDTPQNIRLAVEEWMMPKGDRASRAQLFTGLVEVMGKLGSKDAGAKEAIAHVVDLAKKAGVTDLPAIDVADAGAKDKVLNYLKSSCTKNLGSNAEKNLEMMARVYVSVCADRPTLESLEKNLFRAGSAWPQVADVVVQLAQKNDLGAMRELGLARLAMKDAIVNTSSGYERHELIKMDGQLSRMTNEHLGASVDRIGTIKTPEQRTEALFAVQTALRSALASGLDGLVSEKDAGVSTDALKSTLKDVDAALAKGSVTELGYRGLMGQVHVAVTKTVQNIRAFADQRSAAVARGGMTLDPEFADQFIKQTSLHYATAIAQKGMRVGLTEKISARKIENVEGMRILNGIGPVVFKEVVFAENSKQLAEMGTTKDQLAILYKLEEKKMVAVGGLMVDTEHAPGGNSHLNMYAMNNGIPVVALPELRTKYAEFFKTAQKEGGLYMDDSGDGFTMMTVKMAQEEGKVSTNPAEIDKMRPGVNRKITFLKPTSDGASFEVAAKHDAIINEKRITHDVEIFLPQDEIKGIGRGVPTWDQLATLGIHARHLAGEKGTVLALMGQHPKLKAHTMPGSTVTPADVADLLEGAKGPNGQNLKDMWDNVWEKDPKVGVVDDRNFTKSAFYTDASYRKQTRETLQTATREGLEKSLLDLSKTPATMTAAGQALYDKILQNKDMATAQNGSMIFRSSYTAEDRPGKSGAGQYESYVDRQIGNKITGKAIVDASFASYEGAREALVAAKKTGRGVPQAQAAFDAAAKAHNDVMGPARVWSALGVVESAWMAEPVENNVAEQFFLKHVGCTIACQATVKPDISGVMISRDLESGARNQVTFQLVKGFGGGVEGGKTTEGVITEAATRTHVVDGKETSGAKVDVQDIHVDEADMQKLREIVLETERFFDDTVEAGKGHAVDMEVARQDGQWYVVQARVIQMDK